MSQDDLLDELLEVPTTAERTERLPIVAIILPVVLLPCFQVMAMWALLAEEVKIAFGQTSESLLVLFVLLALWQLFFSFRDQGDVILRRRSQRLLVLILIELSLIAADISRVFETDGIILFLTMLFFNAVYAAMWGSVMHITLHYWRRRAQAASWYGLWESWLWAGVGFFVVRSTTKRVDFLLQGDFSIYGFYMKLYPYLFAFVLMALYAYHRRTSPQIALANGLIMTSGAWWWCVQVGGLELDMLIPEEVVAVGSMGLFGTLLLLFRQSRQRDEKSPAATTTPK